MADGKTLRFRFEGVEYTFDPLAMTGRLERELWKATRLSVPELVEALGSGASFGVAGVIWLARRQGGDMKVSYADVEGYIDGIDKSGDVDLELLGDEQVGGDDDPQL